MKKFSLLIYVFIASFIIGCNEDIKEVSQDAQIADREIEPGEIPRDHQFYKASSYEELLSVYKKASKEETDEDYFANLRQYSLFKILNSDSFYSTSTKEQQLFIINELAEMKSALANIESFYNLLDFMRKNDVISDSRAIELTENFRKKNELALQKSNMDDELKKEKEESLRKGNLKIMKPIRDKQFKNFEKK